MIKKYLNRYFQFINVENEGLKRILILAFISWSVFMLAVTIEVTTQYENFDILEKLQIVYNEVSKKYDIGDFDTFESKMQDDDKRRIFYDSISKDFALGDYETFTSKVSYSYLKTKLFLEVLKGVVMYFIISLLVSILIKTLMWIWNGFVKGKTSNEIESDEEE